MVRLNTLFYNEDKNILLLKIACLYWLFAKLMCWRIWTTNRLLPTVPLFECFDRIPPIIHAILFALSLLLLVLLFLKNNRFLLAGLLATEIFSCLLDQNRLLPWEYLYVFIIIIFIINTNTPKYIVSSISFLLISTYFYSGLSKLNEGFLTKVWTNMILKGLLKLPANIAGQNWIHYSGYVLGVTELLAGIGLLFVKTRSKSVKFLVAMHLFVLLLLGPLGYRGYNVLWPWNVAMILFLYFIFWKKNNGISVFQVTRGWNKLVLMCWCVLPAFSFVGYWDNNLSSNLFSANVPRMIICVDNTSECKPLQRFFSKKDIPNTCHGLAKIDVQNWAVAETSVAAYPEIRVYKTIQEKLEKQYPAAGLRFFYFNNGTEK